MTVFSFWRHDRFPGLDMEVSITPSLPGCKHAAKTCLIARGDDAARLQLNTAMEEWGDRNRIAVPPSLVHKDWSKYEFEVRSWTSLADYLLVWVGAEHVLQLLQERGYLERNIAVEVRGLGNQVERLTDKLDLLQGAVTKWKSHAH